MARQYTAILAVSATVLVVIAVAVGVSACGSGQGLRLAAHTVAAPKATSTTQPPAATLPLARLEPHAAVRPLKRGKKRPAAGRDQSVGEGPVALALPSVVPLDSIGPVTWAEQMRELEALAARASPTSEPPVADALPPAAADLVVKVPPFPWPPPRASAMQVIPNAFLTRGSTSRTLGEVAAELETALSGGGYFERSYFSVPDGFALVTRLEQINDDGTPKSGTERWVLQTEPMKTFSLADYLRRLFLAPPGHYRIIVFITSPVPFAESPVEINRGQAVAWLSQGLNKLPSSIAAQEFGNEYTCTALIYEFENSGGAGATVLLPGRIEGMTHLMMAHVWAGLAQ